MTTTIVHSYQSLINDAKPIQLLIKFKWLTELRGILIPLL